MKSGDAVINCGLRPKDVSHLITEQDLFAYTNNVASFYCGRREPVSLHKAVC